MNRRHFINKTLTGAAVLQTGVLIANAENPTSNAPAFNLPGEVVRKRGPQELTVVYAFVGAGHGNLDKVKELVAQDPHLV
jgi:hypothetical protein